MHNNIIIMRSQGDEAPSHEQLQRAREPRYFEINTFGLNFSELLWIFNDKYKIMMKDDRSTMIEAIVQSWLKKVKLCLRRHLVEGPRNGRVLFYMKRRLFPGNKKESNLINVV